MYSYTLCNTTCCSHAFNRSTVSNDCPFLSGFCDECVVQRPHQPLKRAAISHFILQQDPKNSTQCSALQPSLQGANNPFLSRLYCFRKRCMGPADCLCLPDSNGCSCLVSALLPLKLPDADRVVVVAYCCLLDGRDNWRLEKLMLPAMLGGACKQAQQRSREHTHTHTALSGSDSSYAGHVSMCADG